MLGQPKVTIEVDTRANDPRGTYHHSEMTNPWQTSVPRQGPEADVVSSLAGSQPFPDALGPAVGEGILLRGEPRAEGSQVPSLPSPYASNAGLLLAEPARRFLLSCGERADHRPEAIGFVQVPSLDALVHAPGGAAADLVPGPLMRSADAAAAELVPGPLVGSADAAGVNVERCELLVAKAGVLHREWRHGDYPSRRRVSATMSSVLDN